MSRSQKRGRLAELVLLGQGKPMPRRIGTLMLCLVTVALGILPTWAQTAPPVGSPQQQKVPGAPPEGRDPFRPLIQKKDAGLSKEEVALGRLKLVGILRDRDGQARALVETQDGLGYILREKDSILGGQVVEISSESVKFAIREEQGRSRIVSIPLYPN